MAEKISTLLLYLVMVGMLVTGSLNTIFVKLQNLEYVVVKTAPQIGSERDSPVILKKEEFKHLEGEMVNSMDYYKVTEGNTRQFNHAFFQTFLMFVAEFICLGAYGVIYWMDKKKYGDASLKPEVVQAKKAGLKTNVNVWILAIPAILDIVATSLNFMALTMIPASVFQIMSGLIVFVAALLSIIFLKRKYHRHHWTALAFVVGGVAIAGASPIIFDKTNDEDEEGSSIVFGTILVVIAQVVAGAFMITEEKLLSNYYLHPLKIVGWEGFWATGIFMILLTIFQFIRWDNEDICPHGRLEDTPQAFYEMGNSQGILWFGIGAVLSNSVFNALGVAVTKYASAAQRSTINMSRTVLIWAVFLLKKGEGKETFMWLEFVGFILLVFGTLMFNEILVIPFCGFNTNTKEAKEKRLGESDSSKENSEIEPLNKTYTTSRYSDTKEKDNLS